MIQREGDRATVFAEGKIDTFKAAQFAEEIKTALPGTRELVLDCSGLIYISSSGLRAVMSAVKTMNRQGSMRIVNVNEEIYDILEVTGFIGVCDVEMKE